MSAVTGYIATTGYLWLNRLNSRILYYGRGAAAVAIGLMVVIILTQVVFRYIFNNALAWPDEAARFLMLWMTALIAPTAYRQGGFVAIDMVNSLLPGLLARLLTLALLLLSLVVLVVAFNESQSHVKSGWLFASSSLKIPLQLIGMKAVKIKLAWMYMSLQVGFFLLILVNIELVWRNLLELLRPGETLPDISAKNSTNQEEK